MSLSFVCFVVVVVVVVVFGHAVPVLTRVCFLYLFFRFKQKKNFVLICFDDEQVVNTSTENDTIVKHVGMMCT